MGAASSLSFSVFFFLMIRQPPRSTLSSSSAASDVYKRQYQRRVRGASPESTLRCTAGTAHHHARLVASPAIRVGPRSPMRRVKREDVLRCECSLFTFVSVKAALITFQCPSALPSQEKDVK
eukprot:TRINITY_DN16191_c0_g1_i2.p1 TRINITY_DN16191_c0_g1~~TRINITY_DN16191_c0_g1_i2.p1  ORF type:complete len:122 (+),score=14.66 TRINITY_DN16191_c0_g1_i2:32-397(+)